MYSGQEHQNHIILDTRRKYNMMGTKMREVLHRKMKEAGCETPIVEDSDKLFRFGGNTNISRAKEVMKLDMNLTGKPMPIEVHLVPGPVPFIVRKKWLKENGGQLDLPNQRLKLNGTWVKTVDMGSVHEGLTWNKGTHSSEKNSMYILGYQGGEERLERPGGHGGHG